MNEVIEFKNLRTGDAPCGGCGRHIWNIPLLIDTIQFYDDGSWQCEVSGNQSCADCGEPLRFYYKSAPISLDLSVTQNAEAQQQGDS